MAMTMENAKSAFCKDSEIASDGSPQLRFGLRKQSKITLKSEFEYLRAAGRKYPGRLLVLVFAELPDGDPWRKIKGGVVCGKKYSLNAVDRNRARRLFWESFRMLQHNIRPGRVLVIPRQAMKNAQCQDVMREMSVLLRRSGAWQDVESFTPPSIG